MSQDIRYDYCIIGTGAGGGILAHRLAEAGLNVISIEQGAELASAGLGGNTVLRLIPCHLTNPGGLILVK